MCSAWKCCTQNKTPWMGESNGKRLRNYGKSRLWANSFLTRNENVEFTIPMPLQSRSYKTVAFSKILFLKLLSKLFSKHELSFIRKCLWMLGISECFRLCSLTERKKVHNEAWRIEARWSLTYLKLEFNNSNLQYNPSDANESGVASSIIRSM